MIHLHIYSFFFSLFPYRQLQNIELSLLCSSVGPSFFKKKNIVFIFWPCGLWDLKFPDQVSNPCALQWKYGALTTGPPGKSPVGTFWHFFGHTTWDLSSPARDQKPLLLQWTCSLNHSGPPGKSYSRRSLLIIYFIYSGVYLSIPKPRLSLPTFPPW